MNLISLLGVCLLGVTCVRAQGVRTTEVGPCHRRAQGFARDLANCQQYFVCQNGNAQRARCPGNLAFDAHNQVCWWREEVTCFTCPQENLYSYQPVAHTCHQFYRCWRGRATIHTCPNGLIFHPQARRCAHVRGSGCAGDDFVPDGCPAHNGLHPVYLTHAFDCNAYHICENGRPREVRCQEGLHFNADLRICDLPEKANCQIQQNPGFDPDQEMPEWDIGGVQSPIPCPESGNGFLPHRDNCNAFFACSNNQQTLLNCAPGLHFDFERETCDLPRNSRCYSRENPPTPGGGGTGGGGGPSFPGVGGPGGGGPVFPDLGGPGGFFPPMIGPQLPGKGRINAASLDVADISKEVKENEA